MMRLPRFGIKRCLIVIGAIACWLATFRMPDPTNRGVGPPLRSSILLAILISAGFAAIYFRGKRQAFWAGFFVAMVLHYGQFFKAPDFTPVANSWSGGLLKSTDGDAFD